MTASPFGIVTIQYVVTTRQYGDFFMPKMYYLWRFWVFSGSKTKQSFLTYNLIVCR